MLRALCLLILVVPWAACDGSDRGSAPRRSDGDGSPPPAAAATRQGGERSAVGGTDSAADRRPTVVFVGTSLTAGLGLLDPDDRFTDRIQALADSARLPVRVVNAGVGGETSAGGLRRMDWVLRERVDVLVVELGANDGLRGQDPGALEQNLRAIVARARERYPRLRIVLAGMEAPPNLGPDYTRRFRQVFPRVARDVDATLVPFLLEGVAGVPELNQDDGIHPNPRGHVRIAREVVWPVLEPVLREVIGDARPDTVGNEPRDAEPGGRP